MSDPVRHMWRPVIHAIAVVRGVHVTGNVKEWLYLDSMYASKVVSYADVELLPGGFRFYESCVDMAQRRRDELYVFDEEG